MNRFLTKVLFPKLILFFSGLQHRTEGESHSTSFFSAILMQVWKICNFFFAIQTAETRQCACVLFSLYICILSYDEYTNHSKAPEKKKEGLSSNMMSLFTEDSFSTRKSQRMSSLVFNDSQKPYKHNWNAQIQTYGLVFSV